MYGRKITYIEPHIALFLILFWPLISMTLLVMLPFIIMYKIGEFLYDKERKMNESNK